MANKSNNPWSNQRKNNTDTSGNSQTKNTKYWLDVLTDEENPSIDKPKDDKFEVDNDTSFPSLATTSSTNPERPRTVKAGYDFKDEKLIVVFRDGTWWEYRGVPEFMWYDFLAAESKGKFLRQSGLDGWSDMGPVDINTMPKHRRVQMSNLKEFTDYMYVGKKD
jgi:hypothetical protein